jgi:hypothetical protein
MILKDKLAQLNRISTLTIPTYIAPRYGNEPPFMVNSVSEDTTHMLYLAVEAVTGEEILGFVSKSHSISVDIRRGPRPLTNWSELLL